MTVIAEERRCDTVCSKSVRNLRRSVVSLARPIAVGARLKLADPLRHTPDSRDNGVGSGFKRKRLSQLTTRLSYPFLLASKNRFLTGFLLVNISSI